MSPRPPTSKRPRSPLHLGPTLAAFAASALITIGATSITGCRGDRPSSSPHPDDRASSLAPLTAAESAELRAASQLYWRHLSDGAILCEPWALRWSDDEKTQALLEHDEPGPPQATLRLALNLADAHLYARSPEIERSGDLRALPCVFAGQVDLHGGSAEGLDLDSRERWFVDADSCRDDDPKGRIQPLGCPAALADLPSRDSLLAPAGEAPETPPPWLESRRVFLQVTSEADGVQCLALRREAGPEGDHHGLLRGSGELWAMELRYHFDGAWLTLSGPTWRQRRGRKERVVSRGCLFAEPLAESTEASARFPRVGWYLDRSACEEAPPPRHAPLCMSERPGT